MYGTVPLAQFAVLSILNALQPSDSDGMGAGQLKRRIAHRPSPGNPNPNPCSPGHTQQAIDLLLTRNAIAPVDRGRLRITQDGRTLLGQLQQDPEAIEKERQINPPAGALVQQRFHPALDEVRTVLGADIKPGDPLYEAVSDMVRNQVRGERYRSGKHSRSK